tara:strand:+ start:8883 stop:9062 length:180 start_codon:yes stop_codon:yes gene_type:complete
MFLKVRSIMIVALVLKVDYWTILAHSMFFTRMAVFIFIEISEQHHPAGSNFRSALCQER